MLLSRLRTAVLSLLLLPGVSVAMAQPLDTPVLSIDGENITWTSVALATGYDLVRGDLRTLRQSGGDFTAATHACLADDDAATSLPYQGIPKPGEAFWFLVRAVTPTQAGTYDSGGAGQAAPRDAEIEAAPAACYSPVLPHAPININGNAAFTAPNGVVGGTGTSGDPYVIAGWDIICSGGTFPPGIQVSSTTAAFVIRNTRSRSCHYGVLLNSTRNGAVQRTRASQIVHGVRVSSCQDLVIEGNSVIGQTGSGIDVLGATNVLVKSNTIEQGFVGINLDGASGCSVHHNNLMGNTNQGIDQRGGVNAWSDGYPAGGNYWTNYQGIDACSGPAQDDCSSPDGLGDTPYPLGGGTRTDPWPRMVPESAEGDTVPPTVAITSPDPGATFTTLPIDVSGTAGDSGSGVRRVELRVNGGPWTVAAGTTTWSQATDLDPGANTIEARSLDHAGNVSTTATLPVTYDAPIWGPIVLTDATSYAPGTPVAITFRLTNNSAFPVTLHFPSTCQAFFSVEDSFGSVVYDQRYHVGCFFILTERTWQPGETVTYNFTWNQVDDSGQHVPLPADYRIRGFMDSTEEVPDGLATISITGEP